MTVTDIPTVYRQISVTAVGHIINASKTTSPLYMVIFITRIWVKNWTLWPNYRYRFDLCWGFIFQINYFYCSNRLCIMALMGNDIAGFFVQMFTHTSNGLNFDLVLEIIICATSKEKLLFFVLINDWFLMFFRNTAENVFTYPNKKILFLNLVADLKIIN